MPNRREFLQTSAAVSVVAVNGIGAGPADAVGSRRGSQPSRAIYDDRYAEGRRFAEVVAAQGVPTRALDNGDITRFWYDELDALWTRQRVAIAGFTQFGPMFVVERLALEHRMRLVLRVEHRGAADGRLAHSFTGPRETLALAWEAGALNTDWPGVMGALACSIDADDSVPRAAESTTRQPTPALARSSAQPAPSVVHYYTPLAVQQGYGAALDGPLYSWVVGPRASFTR